MTPSNRHFTTRPVPFDPSLNARPPRWLAATVLAGAAAIAGPATPASAVTDIADTSMTALGQAAAFTQFGFPGISAGNVAFYGAYNSGRSVGQGIYTGQASVTGASRVADTSTTAPGRTDSFSNFTGPAVSGANVTFRGILSDSEGIYTGQTGSAALGLVADTATMVPGRTTFTDFQDPAISGSTVAFHGASNDGGQGIYTGQVGMAGLSLIADDATPVPGRADTFQNFEDFAISGNNLVFAGFYMDGNGHNGEGIFLSCGGSLFDLIDWGDPLFGSTIGELFSIASGLDGNQLTFYYDLDNGLEGVAVYDLAAVPEPSAWVLVGLSGAGLVGWA